MELVKTYTKFLQRLKNKYGSEERVVCLLIIDPTNDDVVGQYFYHRFDYFHFRTGKHIDFFCPGFDYDNTKREFNVHDFVGFIHQIESITKWRYYGGTNLLLMRYANSELHFDCVYDLNFTRMIIDGLLTDYKYFIEDFIYSFQHDIEYYLDKQYVKHQAKNMWSAMSEILPNCICKSVRYINNAIKLNHHFNPKDLTKK